MQAGRASAATARMLSLRLRFILRSPYSFGIRFRLSPTLRAPTAREGHEAHPDQEEEHTRRVSRVRGHRAATREGARRRLARHLVRRRRIARLRLRVLTTARGVVAG